MQWRPLLKQEAWCIKKDQKLTDSETKLVTRIAGGPAKRHAAHETLLHAINAGSGTSASPTKRQAHTACTPHRAYKQQKRRPLPLGSKLSRLVAQLLRRVSHSGGCCLQRLCATDC